MDTIAQCTVPLVPAWRRQKGNRATFVEGYSLRKQQKRPVSVGAADAIRDCKPCGGSDLLPPHVRVHSVTGASARRASMATRDSRGAARPRSAVRIVLRERRFIDSCDGIRHGEVDARDVALLPNQLPAAMLVAHGSSGGSDAREECRGTFGLVQVEIGEPYRARSRRIVCLGRACNDKGNEDCARKGDELVHDGLLLMGAWIDRRRLTELGHDRAAKSELARRIAEGSSSARCALVLSGATVFPAQSSAQRTKDTDARRDRIHLSRPKCRSHSECLGSRD